MSNNTTEFYLPWSCGSNSELGTHTHHNRLYMNPIQVYKTYNTVQNTKCYGNKTSYPLLNWGRWIRKWHRNFQLSSSFWVTVMACNFTFFQLNIRSPTSKVGNTLSRHRNFHNMMKSRDQLLSLQVFVTWSVKLLHVNSLQFLLSVYESSHIVDGVPKLFHENCRDSFSWHSTVID